MPDEPRPTTRAQPLSSHPSLQPTSLDLFLRRTNFPSRSTSSTATRPLVRAWWEKLVRLSPSSSFRFLEELCMDEWETLTREPLFWEVGLGERRSLEWGEVQSGCAQGLLCLQMLAGH